MTIVQSVALMQMNF